MGLMMSKSTDMCNKICETENMGTKIYQLMQRAFGNKTMMQARVSELSCCSKKSDGNSSKVMYILNIIQCKMTED
jgi:hypothetical protein